MYVNIFFSYIICITYYQLHDDHHPPKLHQLNHPKLDQLDQDDDDEEDGEDRDDHDDREDDDLELDHHDPDQLQSATAIHRAIKSDSNVVRIDANNKLVRAKSTIHQIKTIIQKLLHHTASTYGLVFQSAFALAFCNAFHFGSVTTNLVNSTNHTIKNRKLAINIIAYAQSRESS